MILVSQKGKSCPKGPKKLKNRQRQEFLKGFCKKTVSSDANTKYGKHALWMMGNNG